MFPYALISLGLAILICIILFKQKIDTFYDNLNGLSDQHKEYYKKKVIFLLPILFILFGLYFKLEESIPKNVSENFRFLSIFENTNSSYIFSFLLIAFGIVSIFLRESENKYKYFAKLSIFENRYGVRKGYIIHFIFYSLIPILFGIVFVF
jgi:hypothetical protein